MMMNENLKEKKLHTKLAPRIVNATTDVLAELMDSCKDAISKMDIDKIIKEERRMSLAERRVIIVERKTRSKERDIITHAKENYNKANQAIIDEYVKRLNDETKPLSDEEKDKYLSKLETLKEESIDNVNNLENNYNKVYRNDGKQEKTGSKIFNIFRRGLNVACVLIGMTVGGAIVYKLFSPDDRRYVNDDTQHEEIEAENVREIEG